MTDSSEAVKPFVKLRSDLESCLKKIRHYPSQPYFKTLCKELAALCNAVGDELEGLFHLTESHGVSLRLRATHRYHQSKKANPSCEGHLNPRYLRFDGDYDHPLGMIDRLKELPKEWSIVQLTSGGDECRTPLAPPSMPPVWISCLPSGGDAGVVPPVVRRVTHDVRRDDNMRPLLAEARDIIHENKTKPKEYYNNSTLYWRSRQAIADRMQSLVREVQGFLLKQWSILLLGRLVDSELEGSVRRHVDSVLSVQRLAALPDRTRHLLYRVAEAREEVADGDDLATLVATVLPGEADWAAVTAGIQAGRFPGLRGASRQPVLLIVDEALDSIPWESLAILSSHPVSRIDSLHMLHALYKVHETRIVDGHVMVTDPDNGCYMVNSQNNLTAMEERMRHFFPLRLPAWRGTFGSVEAGAFKPALTQRDVFVWSGHGNGKQLFPPESVETLNIRAVSLLMGCSSTNLCSEGGRAPPTGMGQSYHIGNCPLVVGNLWEVSDFDTDRITTCLLHVWLPLGAGMDPHMRTYLVDKQTESAKPSTYEPQPELLRALVVARGRATNLMTQYAIIARGLPVKIAASQALRATNLMTQYAIIARGLPVKITASQALRATNLMTQYAIIARGLPVKIAAWQALRATNLMTQYAIIARGLPVKIAAWQALRATNLMTQYAIIARGLPVKIAASQAFVGDSGFPRATNFTTKYAINARGLPVQ